MSLHGGPRQPLKLIQIKIARNPGANGKSVHGDPMHGKTRYSDWTGATLAECVGKVIRAVDRERATYPTATLEECEICSRWESTYAQQIAEVKALLEERFPDAKVTASDDVGHGRAFD